ncbi:hypothetical protein LWF15_21760 [Kineosporia rhizophila]|uniref:hypothetical protein n=1 Tax=Kineosporia TaxID=49184 RepID=UPI001E585FFE|nr:MULTISPECIES: hypothetical protein [Kineosporia]MCE0538126.1 hypothetical protein [Kineosporia rhizophila]
MPGRAERDTFADTLRNLPRAADTSDGEEIVPCDPDGRPLPEPRRMPINQARPWIKREHVPLGVWPCGLPITWVPAADRAALATRLRRAEGKDCNVAGDALLFSLPQDGHAVVIDESWRA